MRRAFFRSWVNGQKKRRLRSSIEKGSEAERGRADEAGRTDELTGAAVREKKVQICLSIGKREGERARAAAAGRRPTQARARTGRGLWRRSEERRVPSNFAPVGNAAQLRDEMFRERGERERERERERSCCRERRGGWLATAAKGRQSLIGSKF